MYQTKFTDINMPNLFLYIYSAVCTMNSFISES